MRRRRWRPYRRGWCRTGRTPIASRVGAAASAGSRRGPSCSPAERATSRAVPGRRHRAGRASASRRWWTGSWRSSAADRRRGWVFCRLRAASLTRCTFQPASRSCSTEAPSPRAPARRPRLRQAVGRPRARCSWSRTSTAPIPRRSTSSTPPRPPRRRAGGGHEPAATPVELGGDVVARIVLGPLDRAASRRMAASPSPVIDGCGSTRQRDRRPVGRVPLHVQALTAAVTGRRRSHPVPSTPLRLADLGPRPPRPGASLAQRLSLSLGPSFDVADVVGSLAARRPMPSADAGGDDGAPTSCA